MFWESPGEPIFVIMKIEISCQDMCNGLKTNFI
uniref:Uncharacterized protein n=1 Tax=Lepeophtheirus salmonis TaxID=72036 RepID=A0A0K2VKI5_LEPSM